MHEEFINLKEDTRHGDFMLPFAEYITEMPAFFTTFPMHWHEEMEIILVRKGKFEVNVNLENYVVNAGELILIKPRTLHALRQYKNEETELKTIVFHLDLLKSHINDACTVKYLNPFLEDRYTAPLILTPDLAGYEEILMCFNQIVTVYNVKDKFFEIEMKSQLFHLFYLLFRYVCSKTVVDIGLKEETIKNVKIVIEYIQENYMQPISIGELAAIIHFSEQYFMRFFKKYTGMTCVDYMNDYRLNKAAQLLVGTDSSIMEIAGKVGISNVSYFNRMFKRKFGMTPKGYRKGERETMVKQ